MAGVVRVLAVGGTTHGDPYTWVASCRFTDRRTVEVLGVQEAPSKSEWRAVLAMFAAQGVETVFYVRWKNEREKRYERKTQRIRTLKQYGGLGLDFEETEGR